MAPDTERHQESFPYLPYPALRDRLPKTPQQWLRGKQLQDGAEGLWRIHNGLYDLTDFAERHPGGKQWIDLTKGTDVTEAFETHHLSGEPEKMLPDFFVRNAKTNRNSPFTFKEDGFYRTLKAKVIPKLKEIPKSIRRRSDMIMDSLLLSLTIFTPLSCYTLSKSWYLLTGLLIIVNAYLIAALTTCGHNYFHRKDSWRMYLFNLSGLSYADWRVSHALSHHMHTNTLQDLEISFIAPMLEFIPKKDKNLFMRLGAFYWPIVFSFVLIFMLIKKLMILPTKVEHEKVSWLVVMPWILPTWMWLAANTTLSVAFGVWIVTLVPAGFIYAFFGLTAGHHAHIAFFDGDIPREQHLDWGIHQLDTVVERTSHIGNHYRSITGFGDHALHHMFPTLDHGELTYLYPTFFEHCDKFNLKLRTTNLYGAVISHSKQLLRINHIDFRTKN